MLVVKNLYASVESNEILHGFDIAIKPGEIHAVMGPNGSGKTSLAMSLIGHPGYIIDRLQKPVFELGGEDMLQLPPEERAKSGLFVSFQNPVEVTGVSFLAFLRTAAKALRPDEKIPLSIFKEEVKRALHAVSLDEAFMHRFLNEGFSGGERKRAEIVQLILLRPKIAILDEIDSGLDVDSLKLVAAAIAKNVQSNQTGILLITHYQRIMHFLKPTHVHILIDGKIKKSGGMELVRKVEKDGYAAI